MSLIVITDSTLGDGSIERAILAGHELRILDDSSPDSIRANAAEAQALLVQWAAVDAALLESLPQLKAVVRYGIGLDNIDLDAARDRGVLVSNVADYCIDEVAAHALAFVMSRARRLPDFEDAPARGDWSVASVDFPDAPANDPVGVAGVGRIGRLVARRAAALGHPVLGWDPFAEEWPDGVERVDTLVELAHRSHHLSLHVPLSSSTRHMVGTEVLEALGPRGHLVNTSRGGLIDESALLHALDERRLGWASLDVLENEPPSGKSALVVGSLYTTVTPHAAYCSRSATVQLQKRAAEIMKELLERA